LPDFAFEHGTAWHAYFSTTKTMAAKFCSLEKIQSIQMNIGKDHVKLDKQLSSRGKTRQFLN
jgi:hypothetical protein